MQEVVYVQEMTQGFQNGREVEAVARANQGKSLVLWTQPGSLQKSVAPRFFVVHASTFTPTEASARSVLLYLFAYAQIDSPFCLTIVSWSHNSFRF